MAKEFIRVRSVKDIAVFTSLVVLGCVLVSLPAAPGVSLAGCLLVFSGIILSLFMKSGYKDSETGEKYFKKEHYFKQTMHEPVSSAIATKPDKVDLSEENKGSTVRLDVYYAKKSGKAYLQLFEYIPYRYEPCSKMYEHELAKVSKLIR